MEKCYIVAPCRTAVGSFGGGLKTMGAAELGAAVIKESFSRAGISPKLADQVIMGNVLQAGQGQNPARQAAVLAGVPVDVPAVTINRVCGSGLAAVSLAAGLIRAGEGECFVAGGMENMSMAPYYLPDLRAGRRMGDAKAVDGMVYDGLWDAFGDYHMGITAENVAEQYGISRRMQDEFAFASQQKAAAANRAGRFRDEIVPLEVKLGRGKTAVFEQDEYIKTDADIEKMAGLRPAFKPEGTVTAANASGINDGAACMLVVSEGFLKKHNLTPMGRWLAGACCGVEPSVMGIGPVPAVKKVLEKAGLDIGAIDLFELNEAFAAQALAVQAGLKLEGEKVNVNGGAIALGHPIGASGARIAVTLLHEMKKQNLAHGLSALCVGGGMGEAALFMRDERCV